MDDSNLPIDYENSEDDGVEGGVELRELAPKMFDLRISKGKINGLPINFWDRVRECRGPECGLYDTCPYFKMSTRRLWAEKKLKNKKSMGLCKVEQKYLTHNLRPFLKLIARVPDEFIVQTIGMHLVPLYHDLVQLKMEKASLKEISYEDNKGTKRIHPAFDQLLKTHKEIMNIWKSSGLQEIAKKVGFFMPSSNTFEDDFDDYDIMSSGVEND